MTELVTVELTYWNLFPGKDEFVFLAMTRTFLQCVQPYTHIHWVRRTFWPTLKRS
jgi:hypothetical protein